MYQTLRDAIGRSSAIAVGNVALGCAAVALARWSPQTLIVLPPVLAGLVMVYRLHVTASKQRDSWRGLNAAARELADLDGDFVAARGQELAMRIFQPDSVDVMIGAVGPPGTAPPATPAVRRRLGRNRRVRRVEEVSQPLSGPAGQIGLLRLRFTEPAPWKEHEQDVLAAFANLLGLAIENARTFTEARHAAGHDELTGLGNRRLLFTSGERLLREAGEAGGKAALVLVDLDRFKEINDTLGHPSGDRLLRKVAQRLRRSVRSDDLVTRLGGDEFAVLLTGLRDTAAAESVAAALAKALARPVAVDGVSVAVEASIGLACFPDDAETVHELLRRADVAMYQAKRARCGYRRYHRDSDSSSLDHLALVADLHTALADGEVQLRFTPRVKLDSGVVTSLLAVPRWDHPLLGPLPAERFLPAVERSALAGAFTRHVLRAALDACARWRADGHDVSVYIDLFARTLHEPDLAGDLARLLVRHGVPAAGLTLVVAQPAVPEPAGGSPLSALSALGVKLCLSGPQLPAPTTVRDIREIEMAADVVRDVADGGPATATARATVRLAHELGLKVVARSVSHADAIDTLRVLGVDLADGPAVGAALGPRDAALGPRDCADLDTDGVAALLRRPTAAPPPGVRGQRSVVALPASRRTRRS
jgi:diguanylate cyclase (GGDEF)-like protein